MAFTPPEYITAQELKDRSSPSRVVQLWDDDGDGVEDTGPITFAIREASAWAQGLWMAFGQSAVADLADDYKLKGLICEYAMALGAQRRGEFSDATKYQELIKMLRARFKELMSGEDRLGAEPDVGTNQVIKSRGNFTPPRVHLFAGSRTNPCGGGGI